MCMHVQSCPTPCNPTDCSPPGSSVYGILQARILEWVAISFSRRSSWPTGIEPVSLMSPALAGSSLPPAPVGKPRKYCIHFTNNRNETGEAYLDCTVTWRVEVFGLWSQSAQDQTPAPQPVYASGSPSVHGTPLQYSCLENAMDGRAWWVAVHGVAKSWTRLSDFTFTFHFHALEKEMATHSSVLAWRIPGTEEPGGLPSMGSHRVGHDWSDLAAAAAPSVKRMTREHDPYRVKDEKAATCVRYLKQGLTCN